VPATVLGILDPLRDLFAATRAARVRGWGRERFSFNRASGRCGACAGRGTRRVGLELLPDAVLVCDVCGGTRFDRETLEVRFRGLSIADVLACSATEAHELFGRIPKVEHPLAMACEVGLGYVTLGQPVLTLSSGERQRLRLAGELARARTLAGVLYLLDEPTVGLHPADIRNLVRLLDRLLEAGASVIAVDHGLELLRAADHLIELGPGGGPDGGHLLAAGPPAALREHPGSVTGPYLAR
jgi:excinuclease ABC subunit A